MTKVNAGIGYGMLLRPVDITKLTQDIVEVYTKQEILEYAREDATYDSSNPLSCVEDIESLYSRFVSSHYDLLDFYGYGIGLNPDGYAVFALYSQRLLTYSGNYEAPKMPYNDAIQQLKMFQQKYCPDREIGWKQWVMDAEL